MIGAPPLSRPITFFGQNALQIPQLLHQSRKIVWIYRFSLFPGFFRLDEWESSVALVFSGFFRAGITPHKKELSSASLRNWNIGIMEYWNDGFEGILII